KRRVFLGPMTSQVQMFNPLECFRCKPSFSKRFCTHCQSCWLSCLASMPTCGCSCAYRWNTPGLTRYAVSLTVCTRAFASLMISRREAIPFCSHAMKCSPDGGVAEDVYAGAGDVGRAAAMAGAGDS